MKLLGLILIVVLMVFFIANSAENYKPRNDLPMYSDYYSCIRPDLASFVNCNDVIGNPLDIVFQSSSFFFKFFLGIDNFYWYLFFLSFFIYISVLYTTLKASPLPIISLLFLLTDFRFWEYGYNILRAGLAIAIFMWVFYYIITKKINLLKMKIMTLLPALAHTSAIVFLLPTVKKHGKLFIVSGFFFALAFYYNFDYFFQFIAPTILPEKVFDKLAFYYHFKQVSNLDDNIRLPIHYYVILLIAFVLYYKNLMHSKIYLYSFNIAWILFIFSFIFSYIGIGYRFIVFMPPFIAILLGFEVQFFLNKVRRHSMLKGMILVVIILMLSLIFFKNYVTILKAFQ
jgi:hypothetical protein